MKVGSKDRKPVTMNERPDPHRCNQRNSRKFVTRSESHDESVARGARLALGNGPTECECDDRAACDQARPNLPPGRVFTSSLMRIRPLFAAPAIRGAWRGRRFYVNECFSK